MYSRKPMQLATVLMASTTLTFLSLFLTRTTNAQNRLFASVNEFTSSTTAPRYVAEVNIAAQSASSIFNVPVPPNNATDFDSVRDLVVDQSGNVLLYNGTFTPALLSGNAVNGVVSQNQSPEFSTANNSTFGGIARAGNFVFLADQSTGGSPNQGILRVDLTDNSFTRFASAIEPNDINIGPNGLIYALDGAGSPRNTAFLYDPQSLTLTNQVSIAFDDHRAIAGLGDGSFFTATGGGDIFHYDSNGTLLNSLNVDGAFFSDIDIAPDGQIALGTAQDGEIVLTTTSLSSFSRFQITESTLGGTTFVAFASDFNAVPEPASGLLFVSIGTLLMARRRRPG